MAYYDYIEPGDHIYTECNEVSYYHHGIYVGRAEVKNPNKRYSQKLEDAVIHFVGLGKKESSKKYKPECKRCFHKSHDMGVILTCMDCFLEGNNLYRYEYGVSLLRFTLSSSGSCYYRRSCQPDVVIKRAYDYYLGNLNFGEYNFVFNNCEHFATMCKTGRARCNQALKGTGLPGSIVYNATRGLTEGILWDK